MSKDIIGIIIKIINQIKLCNFQRNKIYTYNLTQIFVQIVTIAVHATLKCLSEILDIWISWNNTESFFFLIPGQHKFVDLYFNVPQLIRLSYCF